MHTVKKQNNIIPISVKNLMQKKNLKKFKKLTKFYLMIIKERLMIVMDMQPLNKVQVVLEPELTHKGNVGLYLAVTFLALLNLVQILFPEALFKLSLLGRIRSIDIDDAEPSSFYIAMEHIEWVVLAGACLIFYAMALGEIWSS